MQPEHPSIRRDLLRNNGHIVRSDGVFVACVHPSAELSVMSGADPPDLWGVPDIAVTHPGTRRPITPRFSSLDWIDKEINRFLKVLLRTHSSSGPSTIIIIIGRRKHQC